MFKDLLVPIDFSDHSAVALRLALHLARDQGARLTLLHVGLAPGAGTYDLGGYGVLVPETLVQLHESAAREQMHALRKLAREEIPDDVPYAPLVREGTPVDEILAQVREGNHDLVVMGTHGRSGVARAFLGSVTERVLRHATVPVLVTRVQEHRGP
jgi:nucleotide-binding universal stress UspA family protein